MSWGAIYNQSWWGRAIANDFGEVYSDEVNIKPLLKALQDRSAYYENEAGTISLLEQLEDCKLVETLGEELITNGDFSDNGTGWNIGSNWTLNIDNEDVDGLNADSQTAFYQVGVLNNIGADYQVSFEIKDVTSGNVLLEFNGAGIQSSLFGSIGVKTFVLNSTGGNGSITFRGDNFTGTIDNVSVKEIIQTA